MSQQPDTQDGNYQVSEMHTVEVKSALRIGTIVHYVLPDWDESISYHSKGAHRPAIVVRIWGPETVQLQVFTDGSNDLKTGDNVIWRTSVHQDESARLGGTWHWPEEPQYSMLEVSNAG